MTDTTCTAPGCSLPVRCRGLCSAHHRRALRGASLERPIADHPGRLPGEPTQLIATRVPLPVMDALRAWVRHNSIGSSTYAVARHIIATTLEHWGTPELVEQLAALDNTLSAGRRPVVVRSRRQRQANVPKVPP